MPSALHLISACLSAALRALIALALAVVLPAIARAETNPVPASEADEPQAEVKAEARTGTGTTLTFREQREAGLGPKETMTISQGRLLMERSSDPAQLVIFEENPMALIQIDHDQRSFLRLDRKRLEHIRENLRILLGRATIRIQDEVRRLPASKRQAAEERLNRKLDYLRPPDELGAKSVVEYKTTEQSANVGPYTCTLVTAHEDDFHASDFYVAPCKTLRIPPEDLQTLRVFTEYLDKIASSLPGSARLRGSNRLALPRLEEDVFPVKITNYAADGGSSTTLLTTVRSITVDPLRFAVPTGYQPVKDSFDL